MDFLKNNNNFNLQQELFEQNNVNLIFNNIKKFLSVYVNRLELNEIKQNEDWDMYFSKNMIKKTKHLVMHNYVNIQNHHDKHNLQIKINDNMWFLCDFNDCLNVIYKRNNDCDQSTVKCEVKQNEIDVLKEHFNDLIYGLNDLYKTHNFDRNQLFKLFKKIFVNIKKEKLSIRIEPKIRMIVENTYDGCDGFPRIYDEGLYDLIKKWDFINRCEDNFYNYQNLNYDYQKYEMFSEDEKYNYSYHLIKKTLIISDRFLKGENLEIDNSFDVKGIKNINDYLHKNKIIYPHSNCKGVFYKNKHNEKCIDFYNVRVIKKDHFNNEEYRDYDTLEFCDFLNYWNTCDLRVYSNFYNDDKELHLTNETIRF